MTHAILMLAAGGEACTDIEFLTSQSGRFGPLASDSTLHRTIRSISPAVLGPVCGLRRRVCARRCGDACPSRLGDVGSSPRTRRRDRPNCPLKSGPVTTHRNHHGGGFVANGVCSSAPIRVGHGFVHGCPARNIGFAVVARTSTSVHPATSRIHATDPVSDLRNY